MIEILQHIFLGIVQGLTEFLPVSSSAHLNIMPWLFKWDNMSESFDLALHIGTLFSILVYFFKDWLSLISGGYSTVVKKEKTQQGRIFWYIITATIPAGVLGFVLESAVEKVTGGNLDVLMMIISLALIVMGVILYVVDSKAKSTISYEEIDFKKGFVIGLSQALAAAVPGVSRSGITMTVSRSFGLDRESAAKYSFLLSAPMIAGAALVSITSFEINTAFVVGIISSFISGLLVIKFLMSYLKRGSYKVFAIYRLLLGIIIFAIALFRI